MDMELLSWLSSFLNFLILTYVSINIVNTMCFNVFQMSLSLIGLLSSTFVNIVSVITKEK